MSMIVLSSGCFLHTFVSSVWLDTRHHMVGTPEIDAPFAVALCALYASWTFLVVRCWVGSGLFHILLVLVFIDCLVVNFFSKFRLWHKKHQTNLRKSISRIASKTSSRPNIWMFLWRAAQNILPTGQILQRRGIGDSITCIHCGNAVETNRNVLFDCDFAKKAGNHLPLRRKWLQTTTYNFKDLFQLLLFDMIQQT
ncbi:hypothetical protein M9H77_11808 [Catharanthus roseus]|uniref:Uncharacterized protein n=1 Tax=Catharanthus roseus TaxID=4058 RepID=A0ACC0BFM6_CATRO|nr:hypothetical protein M9H77_11808 [Catharanthus roseus]